MKRDAVNLGQLSLFEPDEAEALRIATAAMKRWETAIDQSDLWAACWCPGARDEADKQAAAAYCDWLHAMLFLDLVRESAA